MFKFLQEHAKRVIENIIANLVVLALAAFVGYKAYDEGIPSFLACLIGVGVFFVSALAFAATAWGVAKLRNSNSQSGKLIQRDQRQGDQISVPDEQIELKEHVSKLRSIAEQQKTSIERYIRSDCETSAHSLIEEPLFIDFRMYLDNSSIYTFSVFALSGSIRIGNRRLGAHVSNNYHPRVESNEAQNIEMGGAGYLTVMQPLTREDAIFILNGGNEFLFDGLTIELNTLPQIGPPLKLNPQCSVSHTELTESYPKLDIKFKEAGYFPVYNQSEREWIKREHVISLEITIENNRHYRISIEAAELSIVRIGYDSLHILPDSEAIYENKFINESGITEGLGKQLKNLAASPLLIISKGKVSGWFQFSIENAEIGALEGATASLILTDKYGERHVGKHDLTAIRR